MRYLPQTEKDVVEMLKVIGVSSIEKLFGSIPPSCRTKNKLDLPPPLSEWDLNRYMDGLAAEMATGSEYTIFLGAGSYQHHIPASVSYLLGRSEFCTSYTPYQPEVSQGTLQAIYEFQSLCCRILGMDVATASHYDGATALAEAILVAIKKTKRNKIAISTLVHPLHRKVIDTYLRPVDCELIELKAREDGTTDFSDVPNDLAALVVQSPNFFGCIENLEKGAQSRPDKALFIVSFTEPLAYGLIKNPGSQGADIVAGEGQSLGIPSSFGGPGLGILTSSNELMRSLPGRLVGQTTDTQGKRGFVLTLATREQHIRREKATSNICSNNSLCAVNAAMYLASLGGSGFRQLAQLNRNKSEYLKEQLRNKGFNIPFSAPTFNEFVVDFGTDFDSRYQILLSQKIIAGLPLKRFYQNMSSYYLLCATEAVSKNDIDLLVQEVSS